MFKKIMVAIDDSIAAKQALQAAITLAGLSQSELRLVNVVNDKDTQQTEAETLLSDAKQQVTTTTSVSTQVLESDAIYGVHGISEAIIEAVAEWRADLIVLGSGNRHGLERFLVGAVEDELVASVSASVLVVNQQAI